jgi:hypothetical protein
MNAKRSRSAGLRRFRSSESGAATFEFVIIFPAVFAIVLSFIEAGWLMTRAMMLDRGLDLAVRDLRIGAVTAPTHAELKQMICRHAAVLGDCAPNLVVELIPVGSVADLPDRNAVCADRATGVDPVVRYTPGGRSETVFVRACLITDPLIPGIGLALQMPLDPSGGIAMIAYSAFVNEPE